MTQIRLIILILIYIIIIPIFSCEHNENISLKRKLDETLKNLNLRERVIIKDVNNLKEKTIIEIEFIKPYISHPTQQEVLIAYLMNNIEGIDEFKELNFIYYLDIEKERNSKIISYTPSKIIKAKEAFKNLKRLEMIEYCMRSFKGIEPYVLDKSIEFANETAPEKTISVGFFELISEFSQECNQEINSKIATETILLTYILGKEFIDRKEYQSIPKLIAGVWEICCPENIDNASKKYLEKSEISLVCE